jgi:hypothetical protein
MSADPAIRVWYSFQKHFHFRISACHALKRAADLMEQHVRVTKS